MNIIDTDGHGLIKAWTDNVPVSDNAIEQLKNTASMPFIHKWIAVMPDVHLGRGATIGSVIATKGAIIPAACGVDVGCGMYAQRTKLTANDLPDNLSELRSAIESAIPHGGLGVKGGHQNGIPKLAKMLWCDLEPGYKHIASQHPKIDRGCTVEHMGTLGGGNHFVEICLDKEDRVWYMLHSGSRGVGNRIGQYFIEKAKEDMRRHFINLPDKDLAYLAEGTKYFDDYIYAIEWAQEFAALNRHVMAFAVETILTGMFCGDMAPGKSLLSDDFDKNRSLIVECHHNYIARENHYGSNVWVTRKGAVRARKGDMGIIPGSMGAKSFIVRGLGNAESFNSCSHGAGRIMSRTQAKKELTLDDHIKATEGVECRKDAGVIDESPAAYKNIEDVMKAQEDLVEIVHELKQVLCVKG